MGLFRRKRGRHALGAAVTCLPSGPPVVVRAVGGVTVVPAGVAPEVAPAAAPTEPNLMTSIAELITSGEAWAVPGEARTYAPAVAAPAAPVAPPVAATVPPPPPPPAVHQQATPRQAPSAQQALEDALATLIAAGGADRPAAPPVHAAPVPSPTAPPALPRVQLGFRDGSSESLDPSSSQSQALQELAQSLTRRD